MHFQNIAHFLGLFGHILYFNAYLLITLCNNLNLVTIEYYTGLTLVSIAKMSSLTNVGKQKIVVRRFNVKPVQYIGITSIYILLC